MDQVWAIGGMDVGQTQGGREERRRIGKQAFIVTLGLRVQIFRT